MEKKVHRITFFHPKIEKISDCFSECYVVGGFLRDRLLGIGKDFTDLDLVTYGSFEKEVECVGKVLGKKPFCFKRKKEVCSFVGRDFRIDVSKGYVPIEEDLKRRDFTINALAVDLGELFFPFTDSVTLIDPTCGLEDLEKGLIRPAYENSISDDPVRILRGIRFKLQLGFSYHPLFIEQCAESYQKVSECPPERLRDEIIRIVSLGKFAEALRDFKSFGILTQIFPEVSNLEKNLKTVEFLDNSHLPGEDELLPGFKERDCLKLAALYLGVEANSFKKRLLKLTFGKKVADFGFTVLNGCYRLFEIYKGGKLTKEKAYAFFREVKGYFPHSLTLFVAASGEKGKVKEFADRISEMCKGFMNLKPLLSGKEIMEIKGYAEPNRCVGLIKEKLLELQAAGKVRTRKEAVSAVEGMECEDVS